jgi:two-component system nitrogen regulation sensor histidine kinase NtrY
MAQRVAHDLKSPLTSILLTLQRLQEEYRKRTPEEATVLDEYSTHIEDRIEHLRRMTRNIMKFADLEAPALADTELDVFVRKQESILRGDLPPDIKLAVDVNSPGLVLPADVEQLQSVVQNLMRNAINAMPEGGTITISTDVLGGMHLPGHPEGRTYAVIEVRDTGLGIDPNQKNRLFEPGFTTEKNGTGLGLVIVRKIITDHNGHIEVESEPGIGTSFTIYLPVDH